jgi:hypothetical protein
MDDKDMKLHFGVGYGLICYLFLKDLPVPSMWLKTECLDYTYTYMLDYQSLYNDDKDTIKRKICSGYKKLI